MCRSSASFLVVLAAEIDRIHTVELFAAGISGFCDRTLNASIVERRIEPAEGGDGLFNHRRHLQLVHDVATDGECFVARSDHVLDCAAHRFLMIARQRHRRTCFGEGFRGRQPYTRAGTSDECDFVFKG